ncbi:hypothetical protein FJZ33_10280 [Candidatus Poribacteria bacterium]|nr:hypothetical protein [Candidatus Poribacteria bacterium]
MVSIKKPVYIPNRYSIAAWPAFPLILGLGISKIKNTKKQLTILGIIFIFSSISLYHYYFEWVKSYDRDIAQYINSKGNKDDVIVFAPSFMDTAIDYYLEKPFKQIGYPWRSLYESGKSSGRRRHWRRPNEMVILARAKGGRIFLICQESVNWAGDIRAVRQSFDRGFGRIESKKFGDIEVILYR